MAAISKNTSVVVTLKGKNLTVPRKFFDVTVKASFDQNPQANITSDNFTFILSAYDELMQCIADGNNGGVGIFEGPDLRIQATNDTGSQDAFIGFVDLQDNAVIDEERGEIKASIKQDNGLNTLDGQLEALDYGYLYEIGVISESDFVDVDYVIDIKDDVTRIATIFITGYLLQKQLQDSIRDAAEAIATIAGIAASGTIGSVGAAIYAAAKAILEIAYAAAILALLLKFGRELIQILVQPVRTHKAALLRTLIEKACAHIGYGFNTSIEDFENVVYLASNISTDIKNSSIFIERIGTIQQGIPSPADFGYTCPEMFDLVRRLFNARFLVDANGVVQCHTENAQYWIEQASYIKPDVLQVPYRYNTEELKSSININFRTDTTDEYTLENFKGTVYQVLTNEIAAQNIRNKQIKGLDLVSIPCALGNRKEQLTGFERILAELAGVFDEVSNVFGGNSNLKNQVKSAVGVMRVSSNNHSVPKLLWLEDGRIPSNNRELFSAKTLYNKYHIEKSFVANNFTRQRRIIPSERIPFGFSDFVKLINNSYFYLSNGNIAKAIEVTWNMNQDVADISYWRTEPYTENLIETFIEPES